MCDHDSISCRHFISRTFYFGKEMGRDMPEAFKIGYWLIIAWAVILLIHAAGLAFLPFLMELEYRSIMVSGSNGQLIMDDKIYLRRQPRLG